MPRQTIDLIKWLTRAFKCLTIALLLLFFTNYSNADSTWRTLAPGIEYQDLDGSFLTPWSHVHVFRINLKENELSLVSAKDLALDHASIEEYAEFSKALVAINGGFFDSNYKPLGLRIDDKREKSPAKNISWWGIFYVKNQKPHLVSYSQYSRDPQIEFAIQSGPRLLINNRIPPLKPGRAERSALGFTLDGRVIILVTDNMPLSTTELAQLMKAQPLNCENALNLDGGSSSQLRAHLNSFQLDVHGFSNVSDAVIVRAKI
ncbi:MAG: phosphodiester glycosidase family protein [Tatlockia sp.]|nr:phosphodiester glycosidase family protein [Tatlockia sp.]